MSSAHHLMMSLSNGGDGTRRRHHAPYLDVMTVQSRQYIAQRDLVEEDHSKLLMEPIHIPDLKHTGIFLDVVRRSGGGPGSQKLSAASPMFYPNGMKNVHLRQVIQESLAPTLAASQSTVVLPSTPATATLTLQPSVSTDGFPSVSAMSSQLSDASPGKARTKVKGLASPSPKKQLSQRIYVHRDADKAKERETKHLLSNVRLNTSKIAGLVNPH
ncbi:Aste57867_22107 [Aphanomyces stellatus]|uniref:Aste57867_22107 protein n=1 Tax=Aphanomyces stellatus TaxID=120398 RepID=A0A485LK00_9STRA|nr:hypothetical protein As57867_022038 [Aphanomyces stellatus]VFT98775.1 Aste57867_22107 [Aphanomyces stellatus]